MVSYLIQVVILQGPKILLYIMTSQYFEAEERQWSDDNIGQLSRWTWDWKIWTGAAPVSSQHADMQLTTRHADMWAMLDDVTLYQWCSCGKNVGTPGIGVLLIFVVCIAAFWNPAAALATGAKEGNSATLATRFNLYCPWWIWKGFTFATVLPWTLFGEGTYRLI